VKVIEHEIIGRGTGITIACGKAVLRAPMLSAEVPVEGHNHGPGMATRFVAVDETVAVNIRSSFWAKASGVKMLGDLACRSILQIHPDTKFIAVFNDLSFTVHMRGDYSVNRNKNRGIGTVDRIVLTLFLSTIFLNEGFTASGEDKE
jgi:hypothetical protein